MNKVAVKMAIIIAFSSAILLADAPVETYYIHANQMDATILKNTIGVLTINIPNTGTNDPYILKDFKKKQIPAFTGLYQYKQTPQGFIKDHFLSLDQLKPVSGWKYNFNEIMRFPIYKKKGQFVLIVFNSKQNDCAWINLDHVSPKFHSWYNCHEFYFQTFSPKEKGLTIDIQFLAATSKRIIYKQPVATATPADPELLKKYFDEGFATVSGYGYYHLLNIKGGFMQIGSLTDYETQQFKSIGWVEIRDNQGKITIWPTTGRSY